MACVVACDVACVVVCVVAVRLHALLHGSSREMVLKARENASGTC